MRDLMPLAVALLFLFAACATIAIACLKARVQRLESENATNIRLIAKLSKPRPRPLPPGWKCVGPDMHPDQVMDDDPHMGAMAAAAINSVGMVFGEVDDRGNLTITRYEE